MADFVIRDWHLDPYPGDQAPLHVHHAGDEAFVVLDGRLDVQDGAERHRLGPGQLHVVRAGSVHTFATVGDLAAHVLCVMTPEIDELITKLHEAGGDPGVWAEHRSALA